MNFCQKGVDLCLRCYSESLFAPRRLQGCLNTVGIEPTIALPMLCQLSYAVRSVRVRDISKLKSHTHFEYMMSR